MVQQKSLISGLKASSTTIDECQSHVKDTLGNLIKIEVKTELCETNCETEINVKCEENNGARRRRAAKKLYDVSLEIVIQQESEPEIISIKDETGFEESLVSLIDTDTILEATMKILEEIEASDENDDTVIIESSGQVLISSEPIEEISSALDPQLVFQELESEVTPSNADNDQEAPGTTEDDQDEINDDDNDDNSQIDQAPLLEFQTENEDLKVKLSLVEKNFDEMKSNYESIK